MEWLENLIRAISPEAAYRREAWRQAEALQRYYDAGDNGRLNAGWRTNWTDSAEMTDRYSRDTIRARARDLERNSDLMLSLVGPYKRNVVGTGFMLHARTPDSALNDRIEELWKEWTKKRNCDVTAQQSLNQMLRMIEQRKRIDGGILINKVYTGGGILPLKLQLLEVDELDTTVMAPKNSGCKVVGGIELDAFNRPVGYWIRRYSPDGMTLIEPVYIDAKDMIFVWSKKRPSQVREMSDMTSTLAGIRDTQEFQTAVSIKQRIEACLAIFIKKVTPGSFGRSRDAGGRKSYDGRMITPGMMHELAAGDDIVTVNPAGQATDASTYIKLQQHMLSAGQGISY